MIILDANLLIYASNQADPRYRQSKAWIEKILSTEEWVGIPWVTIWAFVRITTNTRLIEKALSAQRAFEIIDFWISLPNVVVVQPGPRHFAILKELVTKHQAVGPLATDAVLASLAIEQGASLASADHDFSRFPSLRWINPLQSA